MTTITLKVLERVNNYSFDELEVRASALTELLGKGKFSAEMVCRNEYGSRFTVAYCTVTGNPFELLNICRAAYNSSNGWEIFPAEMFEVK